MYGRLLALLRVALVALVFLVPTAVATVAEASPDAVAAPAAVRAGAPARAPQTITASLGGLFVVRAAAGLRDGQLQDGFAVRMARPQLRGQVLWPWLTYFVQPELAGPSPRLLDAQLVAQPWQALGLTAGQFVTPFSRSFLTPVPRLLFPDFSVANDAFRADRDTGVQLQGAVWAERIGYAAGVFNGNGIDKVGVSALSGANDDNKLAVVARVHVDPLGPVALDEAPCLGGRCDLRLSLGAGVVQRQSTQAATATLAAVRKRGTDVGVDAALYWQRLHLQAEWYERWQTEGSAAAARSRGGYAQAGLMLVPDRLGIAARYSLVQPNLAGRAQDLQVTELQLVGYALGHRAKGLLRAAHRTEPSASEDAWTLQLQWAL